MPNVGSLNSYSLPPSPLTPACGRSGEGVLRSTSVDKLSCEAALLRTTLWCMQIVGICELPILEFGNAEVELSPRSVWARSGSGSRCVQGRNADVVVTLVEASELTHICMETAEMEPKIKKLMKTWYHLPIGDCTAPGKDFELEWISIGKALRSILRNWGKVVVHCQGGSGRSETVACRN